MEKGNRKLQMLKHSQALAFALALVFIAVKSFAPGGAPTLDNVVLLYALTGVGVNFGAFVIGNVKGDHKADAPPPAPAA